MVQAKAIRAKKVKKLGEWMYWRICRNLEDGFGFLQARGHDGGSFHWTISGRVILQLDGVWFFLLTLGRYCSLHRSKFLDLEVLVAKFGILIAKVLWRKRKRRKDSECLRIASLWVPSYFWYIWRHGTLNSNSLIWGNTILEFSRAVVLTPGWRLHSLMMLFKKY